MSSEAPMLPPQGPSPAAGEESPRQPTFWFDVEDLLIHFETRSQLGGVQRAALELMQQAQARFGHRVRFCRLNSTTGRVEAFEFADLIAARTRAASNRQGRWLPSRRPSRNFASRGGQRAFAQAVWRGDVLVCLGAAWTNRQFNTWIDRANEQFGIKLALLIHHLLAVTDEKLFSPDHVAEFRQWVNQAIPRCDLILTPSRHGRDELLNYCRRNGWRAPPTAVIRFGADFSAESADSAPALELPPRFVLFVSAIEPRKNHRLLLRVWRRLVLRHGVEQVPHLVFVGQPGWQFDDLLAELKASKNLDGKVILLSSFTDAELRLAYQQCLFTVHPSLCEGWALPVAESLALGKFCIASNRGTMPEIGGELVDYFDPANEEQALASIERGLFEPGYLEARTARVKAEYIAPSWADGADSLIKGLDALAPRDWMLRR